jgi:hypothetical protein
VTDLVQYTASFDKGIYAEDFFNRLSENPAGWHATDLVRKTRARSVTWTGPNTGEYFQDMLETVGYYSPTQGRQSTLRGGDRWMPAPRTY